jgi:hypothetical protein
MCQEYYKTNDYIKVVRGQYIGKTAFMIQYLFDDLYLARIRDEKTEIIVSYFDIELLLGKA